MNKKLFLFILLLIVALAVSGQSLSLDTVKENHQQIQNYFFNFPIISLVSYFFIYVLVTTLSIPGATILTLIGSYYLGFWKSLVLISFASTIGATFSFLLSRYLFKDYLLAKFPKQFATVNKGVNENGGKFLISLRLFPLFPFFLINILMGLTNIKIKKYYVLSQLAMLPGTIVYINAGVNLSKISSINEIMTPKIFLSFTLIALLPLLMKPLKRWL